jgi:hypothetical protein
LTKDGTILAPCVFGPAVSLRVDLGPLVEKLGHLKDTAKAVERAENLSNRACAEVADDQGRTMD